MKITIKFDRSKWTSTQIQNWFRVIDHTELKFEDDGTVTCKVEIQNKLLSLYQNWRQLDGWISISFEKP